MTKYGSDWWRMVIYWRLYCLMGYLMGPCLPMRVADGIDRRILIPILDRWVLMDLYDTWTMRLRIIFYGKWSDLVYGKGAGS
jgi:hypothetical protein